MQRPSRKLVYVWRLRLLLLAAVGIAAGRFAARRFPTAAALGVTLLLGVCVMAAAYAPQFVQAFSYEQRHQTLVIHMFVYLRHTVVLPQARLLFARVYQTPLYALFHLRGVMLYGCGMRVFLPGLSPEQTQEILALVGISAE